MGQQSRAPTQIISLPQGGGALRGLGEKFSPNLHTGTGNFTVPIAVPDGRNGFAPVLDLTYSSGQGNGPFGLGWSISVPQVTRKATKGIPGYDDTRDVFLISGAEDLVPVQQGRPNWTLYRPRTEGLFARITHRREMQPETDVWIVESKDGLISTYGGEGITLFNPTDPGQVFAWPLTETRDLFGNVIRYDYELDEGDRDGHRWRQLLLARISYADHDDGGPTKFLATVEFGYEDRPDPFSDYRAGFEIRTTRRCRTITTATHAGATRLVRRYEFSYSSDPYNRTSLLQHVRVVGFDDSGDPHFDLPPLEFGYGRFAPVGRTFRPVSGEDLPATSLAHGAHELVMSGRGVPDLIELGATARHWRNLGGNYDRPRRMPRAPAGVRLDDSGVQLLDFDGDARTDLMLTRPQVSGFFPLTRDAEWGAFRPFSDAPGFNLEDPQVRLLDLDGDGCTDVLRAERGLHCYFHDPEEGWRGPVMGRSEDPDGPQRLSFADPRVKLADLTGDGMQDLVLVQPGQVLYWPNLGHGRWGARLVMPLRRRLPPRFDPRRVLLGDVDGDGLADLVFVDANGLQVHINQGGNHWSEPVIVQGAPAMRDVDDLRIVDLLGSGTGGVLWSRDADASGRPSMYFLDLAGGGKPRLLESMNNNIGASTRVEYAPSSRFAIEDNRRPQARWRTSLPIVVPVVARVTVRDNLSRSMLVTEYRYHQGSWDGPEQEFRGFGCVEQLDTQTFDAYSETVSTAGDEPVPAVAYSPPTLLKTWFHLGPVDTTDGDWHEPDWSDTYWDGDPGLLRHTDQVNRFLRSLRDTAGRADRRARRDALRALRGSVLRTELYGLDGSRRQDRPYSVTEHTYDLREESAGSTPGHTRVFFPFLVATRTTEWERGDDPMTRFSFAGDHDPFGQPRQATTVAVPRRSARRSVVAAAVVGNIRPDEDRVLATHSRTAYAEPRGALHLHDRVAQVRTYTLRDPPRVIESQPEDTGAVLRDQAATAEAVRQEFRRLDAGAVQVIGHLVHHYDGDAFVGLGVGWVGDHGVQVRTEQLVHTDGLLKEAYGADRPAYLDGPAALPAGAPPDFGASLGYVRRAADAIYEAGWYTDTLRQAFDVQLSTPADPLPERGLVLGIEDALGHRTTVTPDAYWLHPQIVRDAAGLETTAEYDYRYGRPLWVLDANGHSTHYRYHPVGLLACIFLKGRDGDGGTEDDPEIRYFYDFLAWVDRRQPIEVWTVQRVHHVRAGVSDEMIKSVEYSDGFGRILQKQAQADDLAFGESGDDVGLLVPDAGGVLRPVAGEVAGPAVGVLASDRIVVSGWQVYDNKGRVVERYEPFFDRGWGFRPHEQARRGRRVRTFYEPRDRAIRVVDPDGAESRILLGIPTNLGVPEDVEPSPWVVTTYDANDLAPLSFDTAGQSLADRAPVEHHATPTTTTIDGFGRAVCELVRNGTRSAELHATRTRFDIRGNPVAVVDPLGRTAFRQVYDLMDRPLRVDSIDAGWKTVVYDAVGNRIEALDARGCVQLRTYDALNRPSLLLARDRPQDRLTVRERIRYGDGGRRDQPVADRAAARIANRLGRPWRHDDEAGELVIDRYDFKGNIAIKTRRVVRDSALAADWTADWAAPGARDVLEEDAYRTDTSYDALNRVTEVLAPAAAQQARPRTTFAYGRSGALTSVSLDGSSYIDLIAHNARGQRVLIAYGNGTMTRYAYDPDSFRILRLRSEAVTRNEEIRTGQAPLIQDLTYTYDLAGNPTTIEERVPGCGVAGSAHGRDRLVRTFGYDPLYRVIEVTGRACASIPIPRPFTDSPRCGRYRAPFRGAPPVPNQANAPDLTEKYTETFEYDPVGNMLRQRYAGRRSGSTAWVRQYGMGDRTPDQWRTAPNNRLTSITHGATTASLRYDGSGNLLRGTMNRSLTWDHAGQLVGVRTTAGAGTSLRARYLYGSDGLRVKTWVQRGPRTANTETTVSIDGIFEEHRWTRDGGGRNVEVHVFDGPDRVAADRRGTAHPDDAGPAIRFELNDHIGSTTVTVNANREWINREEYFTYGETSFGGYAAKRFRFTGTERERTSGLAYHGGRYYGPQLARWVSTDPAGPVDGVNLYTAFRCNPVARRDRNGLASTQAQPGAGASLSNQTPSANLGSDYSNFTLSPPEIVRLPTIDLNEFLRQGLSQRVLPEGPTIRADATSPAEASRRRVEMRLYKQYQARFPEITWQMFKLLSSAEANAASDPVRWTAQFGPAFRIPGITGGQGGAGRNYVRGAPTHMSLPRGRQSGPPPRNEIRDFQHPVDLGRKLDYLFGKASGSEHNKERSRQMLNIMNWIGIPDTPVNRQFMAEHLRAAFNAGGSFQTEGTIQQQGRTVHQSLLVGPDGSVLLESVWEQNQLITFKLYHSAPLPPATR